MIAVLFWLFVAIDVAALLFFFVLGLAAAGSTGDSAGAVAFGMLVIPGVPLAAAVLVFLRSTSPLWRGLAFLLAAAPLLVVVGTKAYWDLQLAEHSNAAGELTFFRAGPQRALAEAIRRNDAAAVAALAPQADVDATGMLGMTPLVYALRQLRETPDRQDVLAALLAAGADPNQGTEYEIPLEMALQIERATGPGPVKLLLDAGADPNRLSMGMPIWFTGAGNGVDPSVLAMLLDHGAELNATGPDGRRVLFYAAEARNWNAVLFLLDRGADPRKGRSLSGQSLAGVVEASAPWASNDPGYAAVRERLLRR